MLSRMRRAAGVLAGAALILSAAPAHAADVIGVVPYLESRGGTTAIGSCTVKPSGLSLDPTTNPYYVVGSVTIATTRIVVSTALRCRLRLASTGAPQVGDDLTLALPGNTSVVVGVIPVSSFGPFLICMYVDAVFSDTSHFNPTGAETCRPLTGV